MDGSGATGAVAIASGRTADTIATASKGGVYRRGMCKATIMYCIRCLWKLCTYVLLYFPDAVRNRIFALILLKMM